MIYVLKLIFTSTYLSLAVISLWNIIVQCTVNVHVHVFCMSIEYTVFNSFS